MNNSSPFYISLIGSEPTYDFIVNAGDINSFVLSTYKAKYDEIKGKKTIEERDYYARVGEGTNVSKAFKFGDFFTPTFSTNSNCQVYLTIPKIPAGFNFIPGQTEGLRKDWWLKPSLGNINFLNQFKIVKSNDENFESEKTKNFSSINTDDTDWRTSAKNNTQFLADTNYSGKVYIKLADINSPVGNVKKFFNSDVVSPTRYIRYGCLNLKNVKLYVDVFGLLDRSIDTAIDPGIKNSGNWKTVKFFYKIRYDNFQIPNIFNFETPRTINTETIRVAIERVFAYFYYDFLRGETKALNTGTRLERPLVGRVLIVYKDTLGDKLKVFKAIDKWEEINILINDSNRETNPHSAILGKLQNIKAMTKLEAIERIFGWPEAAIVEAEKLIEFSGF
jgi:hypothetical protein